MQKKTRSLWGKSFTLAIVIAMLMTSTVAAANPAAATPAVGNVLINEFVAANGTVETSEWVELYNTTDQVLTIGGMYIDDIANSGGSPKQILPLEATIPAHGYYVMTFNGFLNNDGGDDVRLLGTNGTTVHDSFTYTSVATDMSWCRKPDGGDWSPIECYLPTTKGSTNTPPLPPGTWTPGTLEIHVFNVGQGESQLIIGPGGKTMLIDVFEASANTNNGADFIASEIRRITGGEHVDYVMASHWHLDHIGTAYEGGIWSLLEQQGITAGKLIDRDGGTWVDKNGDGACDPTLEVGDPNLEVEWHNIGTTSGTATKWVCWATDPSTKGGAIREIAKINSTNQIDLGSSEGVIAKIVQVDANGVKMVDGVTLVAGDHTADYAPPSENDYSITVWLNWGAFDYVTGGDTDGKYDASDPSIPEKYVYNDVETVVANSIGQEVEVIWVNHHGSGHSTNQNYVDMLDPTVAIYSPGETNDYGHPSQEVLNRLYANDTKQYFTQSGNPDRDYHDAVIVDGNVVVQVTDGVHYTVHGDPYVATNPPFYSVEITPATAALGAKKGATATYTLTIKNTGNTTDTFNITMSGNAWSTTVTPSTPITLAPGGYVTITVKVTVPSTARIGTTDKVTVKATSIGDPSKWDSAILTTTVRLR